MSPQPKSEEQPTEPTEQPETGEQPTEPTEQPETETETETETDAATGPGAAAEPAAAEPPAATARRSSRRRSRKAPEPGEGEQVCFVCEGAGVVLAEMREARDASACETCNGLGMVFTGSLVPEHAAIPCTACHGLGYTGPPAAAIAPLPEAEHSPLGVSGDAPPAGMPLELPPLEPVPPAPAEVPPAAVGAH